MLKHNWVALFVVVLCGFKFRGIDASAGDAHPYYRTCLEQCEETGCVAQRCFPHCSLSGLSVDAPWFLQEPLYLQWKKLDCQSDCRYYCMGDSEKKREAGGYGPVKYHGKWPFKRVYGIQFISSGACLSSFFCTQPCYAFSRWVSFIILIFYKLPLRRDKKVYYEYASLWHIYGILALNSWFWSAVFHSRDIDLTEILDYSAAVALLGYSLIVALMRSFNVRHDAIRVMVAAPLLAFVTTHILYLNFFKLDYGWNMKVCAFMAVAQLLTWAIWAGITRHPSRWKLWFVVVGGALAMLLEIYDFPPYGGFLDAHAIWHATTIPLTYIWWSFIRDDAEFLTSIQVKKLAKKSK